MSQPCGYRYPFPFGLPSHSAHHSTLNRGPCAIYTVSYLYYTWYQFAVVQLLSHVWLFANQWTAAHQAPLSSTVSLTLPTFMSIELVMPSNHLILCCPLSLNLPSFPTSGSYPMSWLSTSGGQSIGVSTSASVLLMNIQDWFPLGWTGWISLQSKGLSGVFSSTRIQNHQFFSAQPSLWSNSHICPWLLENHSFD